ncbi:MAG: hypothetical protein NT010_06420 [Proteobacteria bacterium]|nr:hypothetical protein [Pseudomonadota bacterium]
MKKISFISLLLIILPYTGFTQSTGNNQTVYTLSPLVSISPKIYVLNGSDLKKYQLPKNYMLVKYPSKNTVTLWEFPNEFSSGQVENLPASLPAEQLTKNVQEKQKSADTQKIPALPEQKQSILGLLGPGAGKEVPIFDLRQPLPGTK